MPKKDLTIIILTHNSAGIIAHSLEKINKEKYDVVIVDNASKDNTCALIEKNFPQVKLIKLPQNIGYGRANNVALKQASTDFALVLNPDALITETQIENILHLIKPEKTIALAGAIAYSCQLKNGEIINEELIGKDATKHPLAQNEKFYFVKFITGAALFMNLQIMRQVGFFDEGFFLYGEDNEICKRVLRKGYKNAIIKNSKFLHLSGRSSQLSEEEIAKIYWHKFGWSKCYYTEKMYGPIIARLKALRMILKSLLKITIDVVKNRPIHLVAKSTLRGSFAYLIGIKAFKKDGTING